MSLKSRVRLSLVAVVVLVASVCLSGLKAEACLGRGRCSKCSCPGFLGGGFTCTRGGCAHHYDSHY